MNGSNCSVKNHPPRTNGLLKLILQKKPVQLKEMNVPWLLLSSNKMTHYFKELTSLSNILQKFDASN